MGDKKEDRHLLVSLNSSQKNENETMEEFNKRFNDMVKSLPQTIKPPDASIFVDHLFQLGVNIMYHEAMYLVVQ
jgi:hypothetical protein